MGVCNFSLSLSFHTWRKGYCPSAAVVAVLVAGAEAPPPDRASCPLSPPHRHCSQSHQEGPTNETTTDFTHQWIHFEVGEHSTPSQTHEVDFSFLEFHR